MSTETNTETGGHKAAEVSQPVGVHLERTQPGVGPLAADPRRHYVDPPPLWRVWLAVATAFAIFGAIVWLTR